MKTILFCAALLLAGCGDKVPQSEAAKKIGDIPKNTIDKVTVDVNKAMQQGQSAERLNEEQK